MDIGPVIPGNARFLANDEAWKRQISQIFSLKIKALKNARQSGENAGFLNLSVHKSLPLIDLSEHDHAWIAGRNPLFYQARSTLGKR